MILQALSRPRWSISEPLTQLLRTHPSVPLSVSLAPRPGHRSLFPGTLVSPVCIPSLRDPKTQAWLQHRCRVIWSTVQMHLSPFTSLDLVAL